MSTPESKLEQIVTAATKDIAIAKAWYKSFPVYGGMATGFIGHFVLSHFFHIL